MNLWFSHALDFLSEQPDESARCCVTSPPYYGLRDYGLEFIEWPAVTYSMPGGEINVESMSCTLGQEPTPGDFIGHLVLVFREVRRVLSKDGTFWLNMGDTYNAYNGNRGQSSTSFDHKREQKDPEFPKGHGLTVKSAKNKDLLLIPSMTALALRMDGWWLRQDVIWHKPNSKPESVKDRPTLDYEHMFMLTKAARYFYDDEAVKEPAIARTIHDLTGMGYKAPGQTKEGGNRVNGTTKVEAKRRRRSVWSINTKPFRNAHFAVFPEKLVEPCILASSELGDVVLDPFAGSGTTGFVAKKLGREFVGCEPNEDYWYIALARISEAATTS